MILWLNTDPLICLPCVFPVVSFQETVPFNLQDQVFGKRVRLRRDFPLTLFDSLCHSLTPSCIPPFGLLWRVLCHDGSL